jgi:Cu(I)/Ag(I) efflux system membrane protein CusA/SilA
MRWRYGMSVDDAQSVIANANGGEDVTAVIHGSEQYSVNVRYAPDFRSGPEELGRLLVPTGHADEQVPLQQVCEIKMTSGPAMLRDDNGLLTGYVYADVSGRDLGGYVEEARRVVGSSVKLPPGYALIWSGQYQAIQRVTERLRVVVPLTLFLIVILLYWNTRSFGKISLILLRRNVPMFARGS